MRLKKSTKFAYAFAGIGDGCLYALLGTFLLFFLTTVAGIAPAAAGTITALGGVWDAICNPIVGYVSDGHESKYGRRKPFIFMAAFPLAIVTCLLFTNIDVSYGFKIFYYTLLTLLFWTGFSIFFVPYLAWGAELTEDYNERTVLRTYTYVFNMLGVAMAMVLPTIIVDVLMDMGKSQSYSWQKVGLLAGVIAALSLMVAVIVIKETDRPDFVKSKIKKRITLKSIKKMFIEYGQLIKLKSTRYIIGASMLFLIANSVFSADRMYFFTYNAGLSGEQITIIMFCMSFLGVIYAPFVLMSSKKLDKRKVLIAGMTISGIATAAFKFIDMTSMLELVIFALVFSIGNTCYWQLVPSMIYDVCEADELAYGKKRQGSVISLQSLSEAVSQAVGLQLLGIILQIAGFNGEAQAQSDTALLWIENSLTLLPALFMGLCVIMIIKYPISKENFERILAALAGRKAGQKVDMKEFKDIL